MTYCSCVVSLRPSCGSWWAVIAQLELDDKVPNQSSETVTQATALLYSVAFSSPSYEPQLYKVDWALKTNYLLACLLAYFGVSECA